MAVKKSSNQIGEELYRKTAKAERGGLITRRLLIAALLFIPLIMAIAVTWIVGLYSPIANSPVSLIFCVPQILFIWAWFYAVDFLSCWHIKAADVVRTGGNALTRSLCHVNEAGIREALGVRDASQREEVSMIDVLKQLVDLGNDQIAVHENWWVIDHPQPLAWTIGQDVFLTSSAIRSPHLPAILAHEVAHLSQDDGKMTLALYAFTLPTIKKRMTSVGQLSGIRQEAVTDNIEAVQSVKKEVQNRAIATLIGGVGILRYKQEWATYFRNRDYMADALVVDWGLGTQLLTYLEATKQTSLASPFLTDWNAPIELRIDRLLGLLEQ